MVLSVLLTPSAVFSHAVLWDTSHGVYVSEKFGGNGYQPSGYYQTLTQHLGNNGFTVDTTSDGFLADISTGYDVAVVCLTSAYYSAYTPDEVTRIADFVNAGGGLLIMGDRQAAPNANIQPVASQFGITLGFSDLSPYEVYTSELADHPVFDGVNEIFMYAAAELSASEPASPLAWQADTGKAIVAAAQYGQGRVVALGDCSLWSWVDIYEENFCEAGNPAFSVNTFTYLAVPEPATALPLALGSLALLRNRSRMRRFPMSF